MVYQGLYFASVFSAQGKHTIISRSISGLGRSQNKLEEYRYFLKELHDKLSRANPDVAYTAGSTFFWVMGWIFIGVGVSDFVLRYGFDLWETLKNGCMIVMGISIILLGRSRRYNPDAIPPKFVP